LADLRLKQWFLEESPFSEAFAVDRFGGEVQVLSFGGIRV